MVNHGYDPMTEAHAGDLKAAGTGCGKATNLAAAGGLLGALAASSCCILPLALFSLGVSGAWIGRLTALAPYTPVFLAATAGFLGYGYWSVYRRRDACACSSARDRLVKTGLWAATGLVLLAAGWPHLAPLILA